MFSVRRLNYEESYREKKFRMLLAVPLERVVLAKRDFPSVVSFRAGGRKTPLTMQRTFHVLWFYVTGYLISIPAPTTVMSVTIAVDPPGLSS
jgi:hypothetical protein